MYGRCVILPRIQPQTEDTMKKIFVTVSGGCAYAMTDAVPDGFQLEIIDFDNIAAGDPFPSTEAKNYCTARGLYDPTQAPQP